MSAEDIEYMDDYKEFPTKESALDWLDNYLSLDERNNLIRVLQQEPTYTSKVAQKAYEDGKKDGYVKAKVEQILESDDNVLDKIRAEILQMPTISLNANDIYKADVLVIIDKYNTESEEDE